jgi:hypothetical protein
MNESQRRSEQYRDQPPPIKALSPEEREVIASRQRIANIQEQLDDLHEQRRHVHSKLGRLADAAEEHLAFEELVKLKRERKNLETDAQLLNNRIELLTKERTKYWKKIRIVHTKAAEIEHQKELNERRKMEKEAVKRKIESMSKNKGAVGIDKKHKTLERIDLLKKKHRQENQERAERIKQERERNEELLRRTKKMQERENILKKNHIARTESYSMLRKEHFEMEKKGRVLKRLESEKHKEKFIIKKYKKELNTLLRQEEDCIGKLKKCQEIQDQAFDKLKKVLNIEDESPQPQHEDLPEEDDEGQEFAEKEAPDHSEDRSKQSASVQHQSVD